MPYQRQSYQSSDAPKKPSKTIKWEVGENGEYLIILSVYGTEDNRKGTVTVSKFGSVFGGAARLYNEVARKSGSALEMRAYADKIAADTSLLIGESEDL